MLSFNLFEVVSCSCCSSCSNTCGLVLSYFGEVQRIFEEYKAFVVMVPVSFSEAVSYGVNQIKLRNAQISLTTNADSMGKAGIVDSQVCYNRYNHCIGV
jgi:hypothetical protein